MIVWVGPKEEEEEEGERDDKLYTAAAAAREGRTGDRQSRTHSSMIEGKEAMRKKALESASEE